MRLFAILGNPVAHSLSPIIHNSVIKELDLMPSLYTRILVEDGANLRKIFLNAGLSGANITVPYKEEAFKQCDEVRGIAKEIGAVNTWVKEGEKIIGYNTDATGFMEAISHFGSMQKILILGAGGTAKAVAAIFHANGLDVTVTNRSHDRLAFFKDKGIKSFEHKDLMERKFDLIINTTSAGLTSSDLPAPFLDEIEAKVAVDAIYGKTTPFLAWAEKQGLKTQDGALMLIYQAAFAFELFFGIKKSAEISQIMKENIALPKDLIWL